MSGWRLLTNSIEKLTVAPLLKIFPAFYGTKVSLLCSQESTSGTKYEKYCEHI
jgi:hypothetical protein